MTTTDLIYEALRNFRAQLMDDVRAVVREEIRSSKYAKTPRGSGAYTPPMVTNFDQPRSCPCSLCQKNDDASP